MLCYYVLFAVNADKCLLYTCNASFMLPTTNLPVHPFTRSFCDTPKRSKHVPLEKVPSFASDVSSDAGESPISVC